MKVDYAEGGMKRLKDYISYNPETGDLKWIKKPSQKVYIGDIAGSKELTGYMSFGFNGKRIKNHRAAWELYYGSKPSGQIDHINSNRSDNRILNLRLTDNSANCKNKSRYSNNSSGVMGVSKISRTGKWQVYIKVNYKALYLGVFDSFFDACCARKSAEVKYGFSESHGDSVRLKYKDTEKYRNNKQSEYQQLQDKQNGR